MISLNKFRFAKHGATIVVHGQNVERLQVPYDIVKFEIFYLKIVHDNVIKIRTQGQLVSVIPNTDHYNFRKVSGSSKILGHYKRSDIKMF